MSKATSKKPNRKPSKPHADFPLFPHATRRWAKKVRGRLVYFGPWGDPDAALNKWLDQKDDLLAGRTPRVSREGVTIRDLANRFLNAKRLLVDSGDITARTFADYHASCAGIVEALGADRFIDDLAADDFERFRASLAKSRGPVALGNQVQRVRTLFKYGYDAGLIAQPIRFGPGFNKPSRKLMRMARHAKGPRLLSPEELRKLLDAAGAQLRAMLLLGLNCGFGNADVGTLPVKALDLAKGWIDYPRPKTGVPRRCPLWKETIAALKVAMNTRPAPKNEAHAGLVFITKHGQPWAKATADSPVTKELRKLLDRLGLHRPGLGFYTLRHVFQTVGSESRDEVAVRAIMGHAPAEGDMSAVYRERISDERLQAVAEHVRRWLWPKAAKKGASRRKVKTTK